MLGDPPVPNRLIRVLDPWNDPQIGRQLILTGKILHIADHTQQDRGGFFPNALDAADILMTLEFLAMFNDVIVQSLDSKP